jgi:heat shock protein HslJ
MVACFDPTPQEETAYLALLNAAATYQISGDTLTIGTASDPAALVFTRDD